MPFCENCGNKVSDISKFCSSCGEKINLVVNEETSVLLNLNEYQDSNKKENSIDQPFAELASFEDDDIIEFDELGMAVAELDGKWGIVNSNWEWILPPKFDYLMDFDEKNYCEACINDKRGFIDRKGIWIIQPEFDELGIVELYISFDEKDYCRAIINNKHGFIDRKGNNI
jgi:hypothetical protein